VKRTLLLALLSFTICKLSAQENTWHHGSVVLSSQEVRVGEICHQGMHDAILFRSNKQVSVLAAHKIQSVQYYDSQANINRKFISIRETNVVWRVHKLYEVVLQGEVSVLRKPKTRSTQLEDTEDHIYYVRYQGKVVDLKSFRSKVYPILTRNGGPMLSVYKFDHHLNPNSPAEAIRIIQYYNTLMKEDQSLARY